MAEFFLPYDETMSLADAEATSQNASPSRPPFPTLEMNTQSTSNVSEAQIDFSQTSEFISHEQQSTTPEEPPKPGQPTMDSLHLVEKLLQFFRALLASTDAVDQQHNLQFDRSISEKIKTLIHRLVNSDLEIPEFAELVQSTVCSKANPDFLPFLQQTVPLFIDAIAHARINVAWLLPYYLKPYLYGSSEQTFPTPSSQNLSTSFGEVPDDHVYADSAGHPMGVQILQPPDRTFQDCARNATSQDYTVQISNEPQIPKELVLPGEHLYTVSGEHHLGVQMLQPPDRTFQNCAGDVISQDNTMQSSSKPQIPKEPVLRGDHFDTDSSGHHMGVQMLQPPDRTFQNRAGDAISQENTIQSSNEPQIPKEPVLRGDHEYTDSSGHHMGVQMLQPPDRTFQNRAGDAISQESTIQSSNERLTLKELVVFEKKDRRFSTTEVELIDHDQRSCEALADSFLHPNDLLKYIQQYMGRECYVEEEALQMISNATKHRIHEILTELKDTAKNRFLLTTAAPENTIPSSDSHQVEKGIESPKRRPLSGDFPDQNHITTASDNIANTLVNVDAGDATENATGTTKTALGGSSPNNTILHKADKREPEKKRHGVVWITADDLEFLHDRGFVGTTTEFKCGTDCYKPPNS